MDFLWDKSCKSLLFLIIGTGSILIALEYCDIKGVLLGTISKPLYIGQLSMKILTAELLQGRMFWALALFGALLRAAGFHDRGLSLPGGLQLTFVCVFVAKK